jgi:hypothetical protein
MDQMHNLTDRSAEVRLLRSEKDAMKARILSHAPAPAAPTPSPYLIYIRGLAGAFALLLIVLVPATYAAQQSTPGDALYSIELGLIEPIEEAFQVDSESRVAYHTSRLEERLDELAKVKRVGAATPSVAALAENASEHAIEAHASIAGESPSADSIERLVAISAILEAQEEILEDLDAETDRFNDTQVVVEDALEESNRTYAKTAEPEEIQALISAGLAKTSAQVAPMGTALMSAEAAPTTTAKARTLERADSRLERLQEELDDEDYDDALDIISDLRIQFLKDEYLAGEEE